MDQFYTDILEAIWLSSPLFLLFKYEFSSNLDLIKIVLILF